MKKKTYHIIRDGAPQIVTPEELHRLNELNTVFTFNIDWYLSNGYVTLESIRKKCEMSWLLQRK